MGIALVKNELAKLGFQYIEDEQAITKKEVGSNFLLFYNYVSDQEPYGTLDIMKRILDENPDIMRIVELGTGEGGTSFFFNLCVSERGGLVLTIDHNKLMTEGYEAWSVQARKLNVTFLHSNVFDPDIIRRIADFIGDRRAMIYCDDGDKKRELAVYCKILKPNDLILAHDYECEFTYQDLTEELLTNCEFYRQDEFTGWHRPLCMRRK